MIYCDSQDINLCRSISYNFEQAIKFLQNNQLVKMESGSYPIVENEVLLNIFDYNTVLPENSFYESHKQYADIHIALSGEEKIRVANIQKMNVIKEELEADFIECEGKQEAEFLMRPNKILILFPDEAHMVKIQELNSCHVEKAVIKVRLQTNDSVYMK